MTVIPSHAWLFNLLMVVTTLVAWRQLHSLAKRPSLSNYLTPSMLDFTNKGVSIYLICWGLPYTVVALAQSILGTT